MMKFILLFILSLVLVYADESRYKIGKNIYLETCASCHGISGKSNPEMKLVVRPRSLRDTLLNEEQSYQIIKKGTKYWGSAADLMPSFESIYDEKQLRSVAHYISKEFNPDIKEKVNNLYAQSDIIAQEKIPLMFERGEKIYNRNCHWCHGDDGKGDGEATRNPEKSIYPYDLGKTLLTSKQMFLYAKFGGKFFGTDKDDMPSWKKKYDDYTLKSVVKYIDETFRK